MRKPKEERIIDHGDYVIKELHRVYIEGIGIDEYTKLLSEYKKLYRRYTKTIKLSDSMGSGIMEENDNLNDNLQYTIKTARNKLQENVSEHKKTKEASSLHQEKIKKLEESLKESYEYNAKIKKRLDYYIKTYGEIENKFEEDRKKAPLKLEINPEEFRDKNIEELIALELEKNKELSLVKVSVKSFNEMIESIEENSSLNNFIFGIYKYLKNSFSKEDIVFHFNMEEFFIISSKSEKELEELLVNISKKRRVLGFDIIFKAGISKYKEDDNIQKVLKRSESAFVEALKSSLNIFID